MLEIAGIADIARNRRDRKTEDLHHRGHKGTQRKSGNPVIGESEPHSRGRLCHMSLVVRK